MIIEVLSLLAFSCLPASHYNEVAQGVLLDCHTKSHREARFLVGSFCAENSYLAPEIFPHGALNVKGATLRKEDATSSGLYEFV